MISSFLSDKVYLQFTSASSAQNFQYFHFNFITLGWSHVLKYLKWFYRTLSENLKIFKSTLSDSTAWNCIRIIRFGFSQLPNACYHFIRLDPRKILRYLKFLIYKCAIKMIWFWINQLEMLKMTIRTWSPRLHFSSV